MTPDQEKHLLGLKVAFAREVDEKYRAGVQEHGGNIWELGVLELIRQGKQEAVDQYVYLDTAEKILLRMLPNEKADG